MKNSPELDHAEDHSLWRRPARKRGERLGASAAPLLLCLLAMACSAPERDFQEFEGASGSTGTNGGAGPNDPAHGGAAGGVATDVCDAKKPPSCFISVGTSCAQGVRQCTAQGASGDCDLLGLSSDLHHCGEDCSPCDPDRANACGQGLCVCGGDPACDVGELCCDGGDGVECVAPQEDPNHCGACGNVCVAESDDEQGLCVDGTCKIVCVAPNFRCDGSTRLGCGDDGEWAVEEECAFGCFGDRCGDCEPGAVRCGANGRELCDAQGSWRANPCSSSTHCTGAGTCLKKDGQPCKSSGECVSTCNVFYEDADGDGYFGTAVSLCGSSPPSGYSSTSDDCCDTDARARPGQTAFYATARTGCGGHDFDCDKSEVKQYTRVVTQCGSSEACSRNVGGGAWRDDAPDCGSSASWSTGCYQSGSDWCPAHDESRTQGCR